MDAIRFVKTGREEEVEESWSMVRRTLNVQKSTVSIVEAILNASVSRLELSSPWGILE